MNKTLLLILVDFLLLNLLALTRWEEVKDAQDAISAPPTPVETTQEVVQEDLVGALQTTLEAEREAREQMSEELQSREESLAEREARLAALQQDLTRRQEEAALLNARMAESQATVTQLSDRLSQTSSEAAAARARSEQLARELAERQKTAEQLAGRVEELQQASSEAQQRIQSLNTQVQVGETERGMLRASVDTLRTQVSAEREEKLKLQEQTGKLAEGVTQLAETSANLRQEIRSNTPVNANAQFDEFRRNRLEVDMQARRNVFLGSGIRRESTKSILVTDGTNIIALFHVNDTIATLRENAPDWESISGTMRGKGGAEASIPRLFFLRLDPRIMAAPVQPAEAEKLGVAIYPTALEPFKFPEAVLISAAGDKFGEVEFKIDPQTPGYVKMQSRVLSRLFGNFAPSAGDLVFSKTGELLGVMVNNAYCVLVDSFVPGAELPFGDDIRANETGTIFERQRQRVLRLPLRLQ